MVIVPWFLIVALLWKIPSFFHGEVGIKSCSTEVYSYTKSFFTNLSTEQCKQNSYTPLLLYPILGTAPYAGPILC